MIFALTLLDCQESAKVLTFLLQEQTICAHNALKLIRSFLTTSAGSYASGYRRHCEGVYRLMVPETHPLREFFNGLVEKHYSESAGLRDSEITGYVANLLAEFCEVTELFKLRNEEGR